MIFLSSTVRGKLVLLPAIAVLVAGVTMFAADGPASAATCSGYSCHGHDPVAYGCSVTSTASAAVKERSGTQVATLWNRYSSGCNANWGRAQLTTAALNAHDSMVVGIYTTDSHNNYEIMCYPGPSNTGGPQEFCTGNHYSGSQAAYTDMVDGTNSTTAYIHVFDSSGIDIADAMVSQ